MSHQRCDRVWQAEAQVDGRLGPRDLASFERHVAQCRDCTAEVAALQDVVHKMAALPEPSRTDLEHRRARNELLRRANESFLTAKPTANAWKTWALAGALALGLSGLLWLHSSKAPIPTPAFEVVEVTNAVWQTETVATTSRVTLQSGTAAFHVEHLEKEARFWVDMPDGRIEVRGTRFVVDVSDGKTRSVSVTEGLVWLDVPSFHGLLQAGDRWPTAESAAAVKPTASVADQPGSTTPNDGAPISPPETPAQTPEEARPQNSALPNPKTDVPPDPTPAVSAEKAPTPAATNAGVAPKDDAGPRFAEAMTAFSAGDDSRADQLFAAFVRDFPRDGRAEDATFLRAKIRAKRGDSAGAAAMAREYLKAFPRGFRRPEAERLAGPETQ